LYKNYADLRVWLQRRRRTKNKIKRKAHAKSSTKQTKVKTYEAMIVEPQIIHEVDLEVGHSLPVQLLVQTEER
jgi:hypothetical protein